ncbi:MAG: hypothetical protein HYY67_09400 [Thaumarchaeota archaeon]|nr:hypothetical protein [Nitrososphaerota archaeon]
MGKAKITQQNPEGTGMKCDYCDKPAVISLCRLEINARTNEVEHSVYKAFCWEDAVKKRVMVYEEARGERPLTLTMEDVVKGTKIAQTEASPQPQPQAMQPMPAPTQTPQPPAPQLQTPPEPAPSPAPQKPPAQPKKQSTTKK